MTQSAIISLPLQLWKTAESHTDSLLRDPKYPGSGWREVRAYFDSEGDWGTNDTGENRDGELDHAMDAFEGGDGYMRSSTSATAIGAAKAYCEGGKGEDQWTKPSPESYHALKGPNSNTYVRDTLDDASLTVDDNDVIDGLPGW